MAGKSSKSTYLNYLPPVLWEKELAGRADGSPAISLDAFLRIFEKILTGIDDGVALDHAVHETEGTKIHRHDGIEAVIARLPRLFNPWTTPPEFLEWLASWLGLEFSKLWGEHERRKAISEISQVYLRDGPKAKLERLLELYTAAGNRPRIAIDDGSRILLCEPQPDRLAPLRTLVSQGPSVRYDRAARNWVQDHEGLVAPQCLALAPDGSLIVGDQGTPISLAAFPPTVARGVWHLHPPDSDGAPHRPVRLGSSGWNLRLPVAMVTEPAAPWNLYVLDRDLSSATLYRLAASNLAAEATIAAQAALGTKWPVAMVRDNNGHLLILDRGNSPDAASAPKIIDVTVGATAVTVTSKNLTPAKVIEPLSLWLQPNGDLIIGDGGRQDQPASADLVRIDRSNPAAWVEQRLMVPELVAPVAIAGEDATHLYVLDAGLKPLVGTQGDPSRISARAAAVYRVTLGSSPSTQRASEARGLVFPTGMVRDGAALYVCDRGEYRETQTALPPTVWRARPHQFGVVIHFPGGPPATEQARRDRRQIVYDISQVILSQKPAHTVVTFAYRV